MDKSFIIVVSPAVVLYIYDGITDRTFMDLSQTSLTLLHELEQLSAGSLRHKRELGILIELVHQQRKLAILDELSFFAKIAHKTYGIISRIGKDAEGYTKLSREFGESLEKSRGFLHDLLQAAPDETKSKFESEFFALTPQALQNLLALLRDVSWYKNYWIDAGSR